jgi:fructose-1,6-bisphosphatase/inositol monophosphatase family enzyme
MAGILCVREAGGVVTDYSGGEVDLLGSELIAGNRLLHPQIMEVVTTSRQTLVKG